MVTQQQFEKTLGVFEQDLVLQAVAPKGQFSKRAFDKYFKKGLVDWVIDEVKQIR